MTTEERGYRDIRKWRPKAARGDGAAISNIAVAYRVLGRFGLSARWFQKAAMMGDGDAMVDYAYCLQHGAGVRPDLTLAEEMYRRAIESDHICENGREEALYLLSVILLRDESDTSRREALKLLKASNVDGDYPVAQRLLEDIASGMEGVGGPLTPETSERRTSSVRPWFQGRQLPKRWGDREPIEGVVAVPFCCAHCRATDAPLASKQSFRRLEVRLQNNRRSSVGWLGGQAQSRYCHRLFLDSETPLSSA